MYFLKIFSKNLSNFFFFLFWERVRERNSFSHELAQVKPSLLELYLLCQANVSEPRTWAILHRISRHIRRDPEWKWQSWNSNWCLNWVPSSGIRGEDLVLFRHSAHPISCILFSFQKYGIWFPIRAMQILVKYMYKWVEKINSHTLSLIIFNL